jgi:hypothetical protein
MGAWVDYLGTGATPPGGHYLVALATGATAGLTANQAILTWRWSDASHLLVLLNCKVSANVNTAYDAAQMIDAALWVNRSWSTAPSGGTTVVFKPNENQVRDVGGSMAPLQSFGSTCQVATTGALTTGTRVKDTYPIGYAQFNNSNALGNSAEVDIYNTVYGLDHPLMLGSNQGIEVTVPTAQGSTGKTVYYITLRVAVVPA